jgi:hypothetical protein
MKNALRELGSDANCEDNDLQHCEFDLWNKVKIYRISNDERSGSIPSDFFVEEVEDAQGNVTEQPIESMDRCQLVGSCSELKRIDYDKTNLIDPAWIDCCARSGWDVPSDN